MNALVIDAFCPFACAHTHASFLDVSHKNDKVGVFESTYSTGYYTPSKDILILHWQGSTDND